MTITKAIIEKKQTIPSIRDNKNNFDKNSNT